jgi:hypothetical protein
LNNITPTPEEVFFHTHHIIKNEAKENTIIEACAKFGIDPHIYHPDSDKHPYGIWWGYIDRSRLEQVEHPGWKKYCIAFGMGASTSEIKPMVYFIKGGDLIKIGVSTSPEDRLQQLQKHSPVTLTLICTIPGGYDQERKLHKQFAHIHSHGEWFNSTRELLQFIQEVSN